MPGYGNGEEVETEDYLEQGREASEQGERTMNVPSEVERLEAMEARQRRALRARSSGGTDRFLQWMSREGATESEKLTGREQSEEDAQVSATTTTGREELHAQVMTDLWRDEEEDEEKELGENVEEEVEVKTEVTVDAPSEGRTVGDLGLIKTEPGEQKDFVRYGSGEGTRIYYEVVEEEDEEGDWEDQWQEEQERRGPSGFIARYTGPERRSADSSSYGWSWNAPDKEERAQRSLGKVAKVLRVVSPKKEKMTVASMRTSVPTQAVKAKTVASKHHLSVPRNSSTGYRTVSKPPLTVPSAGTQYVHSMRSGGAGHLRNKQLERKIGPVGMSELMSNAVKLLPFFHSDSATVEKARSFWDAFEGYTRRLPDEERLLVFQQKLKGKEADRWWGNSRIKTFATLKTRFHNQFLSRTQDELFNELFSIKRSRGESIEEWGDRVSELCDTLCNPDAQFRYKVFRRGLRNKRMQAMLDSGPARNIPEACEWLMTKDMHRPIEEDDEFANDKDKSGGSKDQSAVEALAQQMQSFMLQQQQWQEQMRDDQWQASRAQSYAASVAPTTVPLREEHHAAHGIRQEADWRTQDGRIGCGRCHILGCNRASCRRQKMTCGQCGRLGHIRAECDEQSSGGGNTYRRAEGRPSTCFLCDEPGHMANTCPLKEELKGLRDERRRQASSSNGATRAGRSSSEQ